MKKIIILLIISLSLVYGFRFSGSRMTTEMKTSADSVPASANAILWGDEDEIYWSGTDAILWE